MYVSALAKFDVTRRSLITHCRFPETSPTSWLPEGYGGDEATDRVDSIAKLDADSCSAVANCILCYLNLRTLFLCILGHIGS